MLTRQFLARSVRVAMAATLAVALAGTHLMGVAPPAEAQPPGPVAEPFTYERSIRFTVGPPAGGVVVTAVEADGSIELQAASAPGAAPRPDLGGLYFDLAPPDREQGLVFSGPEVTGQAVGGVVNVAPGVNLSGFAATFDAAVALADPAGGTSRLEAAAFTAAHLAADLTLDDIAHVRFGARLDGVRRQAPKLTVTAPAAPDAVADRYTIFEDGAQGLDDPTHVPTTHTFDVLVNDTDADGDPLSIIDVRGASHGTTAVVGNRIEYTPDTDFSGDDSFEYLIDDGDNGRDFASVDVEIIPVADVPTLSWQVLETELINAFILRTTAHVTDLDGSEFIDRTTIVGELPNGDPFPELVVYAATLADDPANEPASLVSDFLITLPPDQDSDFVIEITTTAEEAANGDTEMTTDSVEVRSHFASNALAERVAANDRSMWHDGDAFRSEFAYDLNMAISLPEVGLSGGTGAVDTRIAGVGFTAELSAGVGVQPDVALNLRNEVAVHGGTVDTSVALNGAVKTFRNDVTDRMSFVTAMTPDVANSGFLATTPTLETDTILSDFEVESALRFYGAAYVQAHTGASSHDIFNEQPFAERTFRPRIDTSSILGEVSLVRFDRDRLYLLNDTLVRTDLNGSIHDATGAELLGWTLTVPNFQTSSTDRNQQLTQLSGSNKDTFLELRWDLDQSAASLLGVVNPLGRSVELGNADANVYMSADVIDLDLVNRWELQQAHLLDIGAVRGQVRFEDGTVRDFVFGETFVVDQASRYDANGDGRVTYTVLVAPDATMKTNSSIVVSVVDELDVLEFELGYNLGAVLDGSGGLGPATQSDGNLTNRDRTISVDSRTFDFDLGATRTRDLDG